MTPILVSTVVGTLAVLVWRVREGSSPVSLPKIVMPPLGMSTGLAMFFYPPTRIPPSWAVIAWLLGALVFAYPMIHTTRLEVQGDKIYMKRSRAFLWVLLTLVAIRFALRDYVGQWVTPLQTGSIFFLLAFGMVLRWRVSMLLEYRRLLTTLEV